MNIINLDRLASIEAECREYRRRIDKGKTTHLHKEHVEATEQLCAGYRKLLRRNAKLKCKLDSAVSFIQEKQEEEQQEREGPCQCERCVKLRTARSDMLSGIAGLSEKHGLETPDVLMLLLEGSIDTVRHLHGNED